MAYSPRILLIGASGQVGWELQRTLAGLGTVIAASLEGKYGPTVDLMNRTALEKLVCDSAPDAVVNAAAYTAVDKAETDHFSAQRINADAVGELGILLAARGVPIIHYSTDFVFSGTSNRPYIETDTPAPLNVYGATKFAGEQALLTSGANALILRTSWVYGLRGANFLLTMLRLFRERDVLRVVDDQIGAPTWSRMLAELTALVLQRVLHNEINLAQAGRIYHLTGGGQVSWCGFAQTILSASGFQSTIIPIPSSEYPAPAQRPLYSVLDNTHFETTFGLAMPAWQYSLAQCLEDLPK